MQDEDHDDGLGGRSRDRREFTEANQRWARPLAALPAEVLHRAPLPGAVRDELQVARGLGDGRARNRALRRADALVSQLDDAAISAIDAFLSAPPTADDPRVERWLETLLRDGDDAVRRLVAEHPAVDPQPIRQALRNARKPALAERARRILRGLLLELPAPPPVEPGGPAT